MTIRTTSTLDTVTGLTDATEDLIRRWNLEVVAQEGGRVFLADDQTAWHTTPADLNQASEKFGDRPETEDEVAEGLLYGEWCGHMTEAADGNWA